jgi:hypothetical protein
MRLEAVARERSLEVETARGRDQPGTDLLFLSYGSQLDEPGPEKAFSFRAATLDERAGRGRRDAARACVALPCTAGASGCEFMTWVQFPPVNSRAHANSVVGTFDELYVRSSTVILTVA